MKTSDPPNGREMVVIMAVEEYKRMVRPEGSVIEFFRCSPLQNVILEIERSRDTGRAVKL